MQRRDEGDRSENIEVVGSHLGLGFNPAVLFAVSDRLAQAEGQWQPFERTAGDSWCFRILDARTRRRVGRRNASRLTPSRKAAERPAAPWRRSPSAALRE
jgi:hypothetical protein